MHIDAGIVVVERRTTGLFGVCGASSTIRKDRHLSDRIAIRVLRGQAPVPFGTHFLIVFNGFKGLPLALGDADATAPSLLQHLGEAAGASRSARGGRGFPGPYEPQRVVV